MKFKICSAFFLLFSMVFSQTSAFGVSKQTPQSPSAFVPENRYTFASVTDGTEITHDFVIQNKGTALLKIESVKTGWGCTAVSYPRQIPAGGEGKIVIKVDTSGYGGRTLTKTITVKTNTPGQPVFHLTVSGNVENFVTIVPKRVTLRGFFGDKIKSTVKIIPEKKYPFKISDVKAINGKYIHYTLEKNKSSEKMEYVLTVENLKNDKGRYFDTIKLTTDSKLRPEIKIYVYGYISDRPANQKK